MNKLFKKIKNIFRKENTKVLNEELQYQKMLLMATSCREEVQIRFISKYANVDICECIMENDAFTDIVRNFACAQYVLLQVK